MTARLAAARDFDSLKVIWKECFFLDDSYLTLVEKLILPSSDVWILEDGNEILSTFTLVPLEHLSKDGTVLSGAYLAAVATPQEKRGRGYFHKLFNLVLGKTAFDFILVRPASEALGEIYRKEGFTIPVNNPLCDSFDIPTSDASVKTTAEELQEILKSSAPSFIWGKNILEFAIGESESNPKTRSQLEYLLSGRREISKKPFAFMKSLKKGISASIFEKSLFIITLE